MEYAYDVGTDEGRRLAGIFFEASKDGASDRVRQLIANFGEAIAHTTDSVGGTALHWVSRKRDFTNGHFEIARMLIEDCGLGVNLADNEGKTAFHWGVLLSDDADRTAEMIRYLIQMGANVNAQDIHGDTPLHCACRSRGCSLEIARLLCDNGALVNATTILNDKTPLHIACEKGSLEKARMLCEYGANVHAQNNLGETPLCDDECLQYHLDLVELLLDQGASGTVETTWGKTPIHIACQYGGLHAVALLLDRGVSVATVTSQGLTPLHSACEGRNLDTVTLLLNRGADANAETIQGETPLHIACKGNRYGDVVIIGYDIVWSLVRLHPSLVADLSV